MARPERLGGIVAVAALGWLYLVRVNAQMIMPAVAPGLAEQLFAAFAMWSVMMVAMMLPSELPAAAMFEDLSRRRDPGTSATLFYAAGYGAAWIGYSALAAAGQVALSRALLLTPMLESASRPLSAIILLAAGAFQFTSFKEACLTKCRAPLGFFLAEWRDGRSGALALGFKHGGYCVGCCWALMALMLVVGAMNLVWMAVLTLIVLGEKLTPARWRFHQIAGVAFMAWGLALLLRTGM
jgi:predicted metal-binding membrane protein